MKINALATPVTHVGYFDDKFRVWYEGTLPYLDYSNTSVSQVSPAVAYKYEGDFYGLLDHLGLHKKYHYYVMIFNNYTHPGDYDGETTDIPMPDLNHIDVLRSLYMSRNAFL